MKIYIYQEHSVGFQKPMFFAYTQSKCRGYISNSIADTVEDCEKNAREELAKAEPILIKEVEL